MDYASLDGVILRTGYTELRDLYLLPIREILDNDVDFLWKWYRGADDTSIKVDIIKDDNLFRIKIRNSNYNDIPVFEDLEAVFNFDMRYGSKQDVHIISRGMLGDAMKQIGILGYVLLHADDDGTAWENKQWEHPLIIRHNEKEWKIHIRYTKAAQEYEVKFELSPEKLTHMDTEIELVLPIIDKVRHSLDNSYIERFCRKYTILTTDISFKFRISDDSTPPSGPKAIECTDSVAAAEPPDYTVVDDDDDPFADKMEPALFTRFINTLSTSPPKAILNIDVHALHPIATEKEWSNADIIDSYTPEEFTSRITNVHNKNSLLYDVLLQFKGGNNIKKTAKKTDILVTELLSDPNMYRKIENLYNKLKELPSTSTPERLSLPYTTNRKARINALVPRIVELYDIDKKREPSYKLVYGIHDDGKKRYPYAFEILAIPLTEPPLKKIEFIGAINYSVSPNNINFECEIEYDMGDGNTVMDDINMQKILEDYGGFHQHSQLKSRLPCIIVGNLITPRRDPHGYDKSRIDTQPFTRTIISAVEKVASGIQSLHAVGYRKKAKEDDYRNATKKNVDGKVSVKELLRQFLIDKRGLPS